MEAAVLSLLATLSLPALLLGFLALKSIKLFVILLILVLARYGLEMTPGKVKVVEARKVAGRRG